MRLLSEKVKRCCHVDSLMLRGICRHFFPPIKSAVDCFSNIGGIIVVVSSLLCRWLLKLLPLKQSFCVTNFEMTEVIFGDLLCASRHQQRHTCYTSLASLKVSVRCFAKNLDLRQSFNVLQSYFIYFRWNILSSKIENWWYTLEKTGIPKLFHHL